MQLWAEETTQNQREAAAEGPEFVPDPEPAEGLALQVSLTKM